MLCASDSPLARDTSVASFRDCEVANSTADYYGAVIYNRLAAVTVTNVRVEDAANLTHELGTFFNSGGSYECSSACEPGEFGDCVALDECYSCTGECIGCDRGHENPETGSVSSGACLECGEGFYTNNRSTMTCGRCSAGSYVTDDADDSDGIGSSSGGFYCVSCPNGRFVDAAGASSCEACGIGKTTTSDGAHENCVACPMGSVAPAAASESCEEWLVWEVTGQGWHQLTQTPNLPVRRANSTRTRRQTTRAQQTKPVRSAV